MAQEQNGWIIKIQNLHRMIIRSFNEIGSNSVWYGRNTLGGQSIQCKQRRQNLYGMGNSVIMQITGVNLE